MGSSGQLTLPVSMQTHRFDLARPLLAPTIMTRAQGWGGSGAQAGRGEWAEGPSSPRRALQGAVGRGAGLDTEPVLHACEHRCGEGISETLEPGHRLPQAK